MESQTVHSSSQPTERVILAHVKVIGGGTADIWDLGQALKKLKKDGVLPFRFEALVTDENVSFNDLDNLIHELLALKKQIEQEKRL